MKKAKGETRKLLKVIIDLQGKIGYAKGLHYNDRSQTAFEQAQDILQQAFELCVETTGDYDPEYFDPAFIDLKDEHG